MVCKSEDEITKKLENSIYAIYFNDLAIDPEDYENPDVKFRSADFMMLSP